MVPSTVVMPRVGSVALALPGRTRKVQELPFAACAGRKSFAMKRIFEAVLVMARNYWIEITGTIIATRINRSRSRKPAVLRRRQAYEYEIVRYHALRSHRPR